MMTLQRDFVFFQLGRFNDPHPLVCLIGDVSGNNVEAPIEIASFRTLFETIGTVDKPTWRAVHKALDSGVTVLLFDRTDHLQAIFDIAAGDWEASRVLRDYIDFAMLTVERLRAMHHTLDNYLINEPSPAIDWSHHHFVYPESESYSPPIYADSLPDPKGKGKPKKQHGPQSRRQWWNK